MAPNCKFHDHSLGLSFQVRDTLKRGATFPIEYGILFVGCLVSAENFHSMWFYEGSFSMEICTQREILSFLLKLPNHFCLMEYKMEFHFNDILQLKAVKLVRGSSGFLLQIRKRPPSLYCRRAVDVTLLTGSAHLGSKGKTAKWHRTTDFTPNIIGQSFAYVVELHGFAAANINDYLNRTGIYSSVPSKISCTPGIPYASPQLVVPLVNSFRQVHFEHLFKINDLVQQGKIIGPTLNDEFFEVVEKAPFDGVAFALQAISGLDGVCCNPFQFLKKQLEVPMSWLQPPKLQEGTARIHQVVVTPTKIFCLGAELEKSNRIFRKYPHLLSQFLRVNFGDENWGPLMRISDSHSDVYQRIDQILKTGLHIGCQRFEFLAYSTRQLKEGQVWMYAPSTNSQDYVSADEIRAWMGDFTAIRSVGLCAARMGQCFTPTIKTRVVLPSEVMSIKDITDETDPSTYCFSDGIGKISQAFACTIAADCRLLPGPVPSAYQIRYGGFKGVVAVDPTASSSHKLYLRPSMKKFDSSDLTLEVLDWTKPQPCHLNRQVITLLSTLGVRDSAFLTLQHQAVSKYDAMLDNNLHALEVLQEWGSNSLALKMLQAGYNSNDQPFLKKLLAVFKFAKLRELREKAKIPVALGRLLMGCLDETGKLNYGQVFVKYSVTCKTSKVRKEHVVTNKVFVAKNPCLHPGDIRVLQAVNVPELGHMVDCVVFPQGGKRPHPDECSGSDLDGDKYIVSWDESIIPPTLGDPPMKYTAPPPIILDHPVRVQDLQEFFVKHMVNDRLGIITNAHVVHADKELDKARNPKCLELARLASLAVDSPKTGVTAWIPTALCPREYPDFMEKGHKMYKSDGILGKLYRANSPSTGRGITDMEMTDCYYDRDMIAPGQEKFLEGALAFKKMYDTRLMGLMNRFGIREEAEIISGCFLSMSQLYERKLTATKLKARKAFTMLEKEARAWFFTTAALHSQTEKFAKASAWYHVTYDLASFGHRDQYQYSTVIQTSIRLFSFPWVVSNVLFSLKQKGSFQHSANDLRHIITQRRADVTSKKRAACFSLTEEGPVKRHKESTQQTDWT